MTKTLGEKLVEFTKGEVSLDQFNPETGAMYISIKNTKGLQEFEKGIPGTLIPKQEEKVYGIVKTHYKENGFEIFIDEDIAFIKGSKIVCVDGCYYKPKKEYVLRAVLF